MTKLGGSSVVYGIGLFRQGDDEPAATGRFVHVWVDRVTQRPARRAAAHPRCARGRSSHDGARRSVACARMDAATRGDALAILGAFLGSDEHYLASSGAYGDGGRAGARSRARPVPRAARTLGFVWLAYADGAGPRTPVGACVVCYAISTSRGSLVAKLDDVHVADGWQGQGVGRAMLVALFDALRAEGITRVDCACHRDNAGAWRFYEQLGFRPLDEERIALADMSRLFGVIPAAGGGSRFGSGTPKQYATLAGAPLLAKTLDRLQAGLPFELVVVAIARDDAHLRARDRRPPGGGRGPLRRPDARGARSAVPSRARGPVRGRRLGARARRGAPVRAQGGAAAADRASCGTTPWAACWRFRWPTR